MEIQEVSLRTAETTNWKMYDLISEAANVLFQLFLHLFSIPSSSHIEIDSHFVSHLTPTPPSTELATFFEASVPVCSNYSVVQSRPVHISHGI